MLDDRDGVLDDAHGDAWRAWLRLSNALALRDWPTIVTTTSVLGPASVAPSDETPGHGRPVGAWADVYDAATPDVYDAATPGDEQKLVAALAARDGLAPPVVGAEGPDGIPLDLSWPDQQVIVAFTHMPPQDRADLTAAGWRVVDPSPESAAAALTDATPPRARTSTATLDAL